MQRRLAIVAIVFVVGFGLGYGATWLMVGPPGVAKPDVTAPPVAEAALVAPEPVPSPDVGATPGEVSDIVEPIAAAPVPPDNDVAVEPALAADVAPTPGPVEVVPADVAPVAGHPCVGRTCRLDFGGVSGGISVRRGRLEDGQDVDWERDFGAADKLGLIPAGPKVRVEVRAVAMQAGESAAAWVVFKSRGTTLDGVIALKVGDKRLSLNAD